MSQVYYYTWKDGIDFPATKRKLDQQLDEIAELLKENFDAGKRYGFVVLSEATKLLTKDVNDKLNADYVKRYLESKIKNWTYSHRPDVRVQELGHLVRGEAPHLFDIHLGARLGAAAVIALIENETNVMVGWSEEKGDIKTSLDEVVAKSNRPPQEIWDTRPRWRKMLELHEALACPPKLRERLRDKRNWFVR